MPGTKKSPLLPNKPTATLGSKLLKQKASLARLRGDNPELTVTSDEGETWLRAKQILRPLDQQDLTDQELNEEITRVLTTGNPQLPDNMVQYSFKEGSFIPDTPPSHEIVLLHVEGVCLHKDSEEAKQQPSAQGSFPQASAGPGAAPGAEERPEAAAAEGGGGGDAEAGEADGQQDEGEVEEGGEDDAVRHDSAGDLPAPLPGAKKLTNQFNFCERATLTYNYPSRNVKTQTIPPPRNTFAESVAQWVIFDAYQEDFESQEKDKEKDKKEKAAPGKKDEARRKDKAMDAANRTLLCAKVLERIVNQNIYDEISQDYKYWEDPADQYREDEGTLLPLWKFSYDRAKKTNVTYLCWNPLYHDCFAAAFGSFDFSKQVSEGGVCLFSLKNPSYPEYECVMECGAMCVDVHTKCAYLLVVGRCDGNVAVYDTRAADSAVPQHESDSVSNKHGGVVWEVKWGRDIPDGEFNFFSVSEDGHVYNWVLMQNELARTVVIALSYLLQPIAGPDGTSIPITACGTTIAFHPSKREIFLVGSEEGYIFKCSTAYSSMFLTTYRAHHMPITRIVYNLFYPSIFVSSSSDWRIKIWEDDQREPLFIFDLGSPVTDVGWSPFSSTVLGAVTSDGKAHVFDLNINKYRAICVQNIVSKKRNQLTRLAFNYKEPVLVVGDDRGGVTSLKLSPNLRKEEKPSKKGPTVEPRQLEINKLEKVLVLVRDPPVVKTVEFGASQETTKY